MRRLLIAMALTATFTFAGATSALAGEVIGPPGTPGVPGSAQPDDSTAALAHANSACAASGLNDMLVDQGQIVSRVQTAADSWRYYGLPKGSPVADMSVSAGSPGGIRGDNCYTVSPVPRLTRSQRILSVGARRSCAARR